MKNLGPWLFLSTLVVVVGGLVWKGIIPPASIGALGAVVFAWFAKSPQAAGIEAELLALLKAKLDAEQKSDAAVTAAVVQSVKDTTPVAKP